MITGMVNKYEHFESKWCRSWESVFGHEHSMFHRKYWEHAAIAQVLKEKEMLKKGRKGLAFGVGKDPLTDLCVSYDCEMIATDLDPELAGVWRESNQHASSIDDCYLGISDQKKFKKLANFRQVDMNWIPDDLMQGQFDFLISCSALEHISGHEWGMRFMRRSLRCLRSKGVAVHTTEYQIPKAHGLVPDMRPYRTPGLSLFTNYDFQRLSKEMETGIYDHLIAVEGPDQPPLGKMLQFDADIGYPEVEINGWVGNHKDSLGNNIHMKLNFDNFVLGSCIVVFKRN